MGGRHLLYGTGNEQEMKGEALAHQVGQLSQAKRAIPLQLKHFGEQEHEVFEGDTTRLVRVVHNAEIKDPVATKGSAETLEAPDVPVAARRSPQQIRAQARSLLTRMPDAVTAATHAMAPASVIISYSRPGSKRQDQGSVKRSSRAERIDAMTRKLQLAHYFQEQSLADQGHSQAQHKSVGHSQGSQASLPALGPQRDGRLPAIPPPRAS